MDRDSPAGICKIIIGADDFLVAEAAKAALGGIAGDALDVVDSRNSKTEEEQLADIRRAEASVFTPPFLSPVKATWWKNVHFLPGGQPKKADDEDAAKGPRTSEAVKKALADFAKSIAKARLPASQMLVISAPALLQTSEFAKTFAPFAETVVFAKAKGAAAARESRQRALERAGELGLEFEGGALERFLAIVGDDTRSIYSELEKLRTYLGGEKAKVPRAAVDAITSPGAGIEPVRWGVVDAIYERNVAKALECLAENENTKGYEIVMANTIERAFRQLVEYKSAQADAREESYARALGSWTAGKLAAASRAWTLGELRTARMRFVMLRERVVSTQGAFAHTIAIELVRALRRPARASREAAR